MGGPELRMVSPAPGRPGNMMEIYPKKSRKPLEAIRFFCLECMGWSRRMRMSSDRPFEDVKHCTDLVCPLFEFRFGANPFLRVKPRTEAQLKSLKEGRSVLSKSHQDRRSPETGR